MIPPGLEERAQTAALIALRLIDQPHHQLLKAIPEFGKRGKLIAKFGLNENRQPAYYGIIAMKFKKASPEYLEKAMTLSHEEAERLFSRMRGKLSRRLEDEKLRSIEAIAMQLELEDAELQEWRQRWAEIAEREMRHSAKAGSKSQ